MTAPTPDVPALMEAALLRRKALATLEKERQIDRLCFDLAQALLIGTDRSGIVQRVNQRAIRALGRGESDVVNSSWVDSCVAPEDRTIARNAFRALLDGCDDPQSCEYRVRSSDGSDRLITWRAVALRDAANVATGIMLSGEDITNQRHAESEALKALERLNSVSRLATMSEIAADISHELSQPLAAIANYAQACVRMLRVPAADIPEVAGVVEQITGQALHAGEIIRRIRSLVPNEDVRREMHDVNDLIRKVHALLASDARAYDGRLALDLCQPLPEVKVDGVQIQQVLMNLVHNAFEAQSAEHGGATFEVRIATRRTENGDVEVSVSNLGPGLESDAATATGLGLAISRSIIKAHGARVGYRANQPRGACFYFVLPAAEENPR
jgi:two-component system, LuxR family, sensor kinase FixL